MKRFSCFFIWIFVLTSIAYFTDGWATRFLTEVFANYTVLFIGYSVNDPVAYISRTDSCSYSICIWSAKAIIIKIFYFASVFYNSFYGLIINNLWLFLRSESYRVMGG